AGEGKGEGAILLIYNVFFTLPLSLPSREGYKMELSDSLLRRGLWKKKGRDNLALIIKNPPSSPFIKGGSYKFPSLEKRG
ncbi:MAG: hypothetical protein M1428_00520, partial [Deltaproteobacteria bacterium]|nr:hypothetical protein [Deltaproteobacteria bacterium]